MLISSSILLLLSLVVVGILGLDKDKSLAFISNQDSILEKDVYYQILIDDCYSQTKIGKDVALIKLINLNLESQVLKQAFGLEPALEDVKSAAKSIDQNTKAPDILGCVKKVFGRNKKDYLRLYVSPGLINPKLHQAFSVSQEIHQQEIVRIEQIQKEIKAGKDLTSFKEYKELTFEKHTAIPDLLKEFGVQFREDPLITEVLQKLSPGEIWPNIIEDDYSYQIVRLLREDEERYYCDGVSVNKKSFDPWFKDYVRQNIKIEIKDADLREKIKQDYSNIWWTELI